MAGDPGCCLQGEGRIAIELPLGVQMAFGQLQAQRIQYVITAIAVKAGAHIVQAGQAGELKGVDTQRGERDCQRQAQVFRCRRRGGAGGPIHLQMPGMQLCDLQRALQQGRRLPVEFKAIGQNLFFPFCPA